MKTLPTLVLCTLALAASAAAPKGWVSAGSAPADYDFGVDSSQPAEGRQSAYIKAKDGADANGFGTMMQTITADDYRGGRWRLSARLRTAGVAKAQLWMRVDGQDRKVLSFDNMNDRPVTGTTAWKRYDIVLDVPESSAAIAFGFLLTGAGEAWADDFKLERAPPGTPLTGTAASQSRAPENLDFEQ